MICPYCHQQHPDGVRFCPVTGQALPEQYLPARQPPAVQAACPNCGSPVPQGVRFCPQCGMVLVASGRQARPGKPWLRWVGVALAAILLLVAVTAVAYWFFYRQPPGETPVASGKGTSIAWEQPTATPQPAGQPTAATATIPLQVPPAATPLPTETSAPGATPLPSLTSTATAVFDDPRTATVAALLTQAAGAQQKTPTLPPQHSATAESGVVDSPAAPASLGLIAFNSNRAGNNDIYVMNSDGSGVTQITSAAYDERVPAWSPDGQQIAYQSNRDGDYEITVYDLESGSTRQVTTNSCDDYNPVWSPDGEWFAFYSDCDGNREIYTIRVDGSNRRQLTQTSGVYNWFPNWSPDGEQITFSSNRSGKYEVFVMNADGSAARALGRGCVSAFSPDGNRLVFAQYCTDTGQIYLMRADGSNRRTLVEEENNANPSWAPDGEWVVFQSERTGNEEIWMIAADGTGMQQLTFDPGRDSAPVWQPTGMGESGFNLPTQAGIDNPGSSQVSPQDGALLLFVPAGKFTMGSPSTDPQAYPEEIPDHAVYLDGFWIDQTEVTNAQFSRFVAETGYQSDAEQRGWSYLYNTDQDNFQESEGADWLHPFGPGTSIDGLENHPVLQVSWFDAVAYCQWAGRRLPTEAEWEKAARGEKNARRYPWGDDEPVGLHLNLADISLGSPNSDETINDAYAYTAPVGSYPAGATPYSALDMAGNAWEWVQDWYDGSYYALSPEENPQGPADGEYRVLRGGGWNRVARFARVTNRGWGYPDQPNNLIGFRCAADGE